MAQADQVQEALDSLWDFNNPAATEIKFRHWLETHKTTLDERLQMQTQIARTQSLQRKFVEAHKILDDVQKELKDDTKVAKIRYYLERGRTYNSNKQKPQAIELFESAYQSALTLRIDLAVDAAHMLAIAYPEKEKQLEWNLKALDVAEKSSDPKVNKWCGSLYNNIGWTYHSLEKYEEALKWFEKALAFRIKQSNAGNIFFAKWCIAKTYRFLKRHEESLEVQLKLKTEMEEKKELDGYVYEELGELYLVKNDEAHAKKYFALAYDELSKDAGFVANESKRLERIKKLAGH